MNALCKVEFVTVGELPMYRVTLADGAVRTGSYAQTLARLHEAITTDHAQQARAQAELQHWQAQEQRALLREQDPAQAAGQALRTGQELQATAAALADKQAAVQQVRRMETQRLAQAIVQASASELAVLRQSLPSAPDMPPPDEQQAQHLAPDPATTADQPQEPAP